MNVESGKQVPIARNAAGARPARESRPRRNAAAGWVDLHGDALYRYALRRVRCATVAEEIVQETFLAALSAHSTFADESSERTWLTGILKHKVVDHFRRAARERPSTDVDAPDRVVDGAFGRNGSWVESPRRWLRDPGGSVERAEFWKAFDSCVGALPGHLADAFVLAEMEGLSGDEVCQVLAISPTNLWTQLHRARMRLRRCLEVNWFRPGRQGD